MIFERPSDTKLFTAGKFVSEKLYHGESIEQFIFTLWSVLHAVTKVENTSLSLLLVPTLFVSSQQFNESGDAKAKSLQCFVFDSLHLFAIRSALWKFVLDPAKVSLSFVCSARPIPLPV